MMFLSTAATAMALLVSTVAAVPASLTSMADNPNLEITELVINSTAQGNTTLQFSVTNPEPLAANGAAECKGDWSTTKQDWPISGSALTCDNSTTMTWYIDSWTDAMNFVVNIQDRFDDPSVGTPPYDRMTTFSKAIVNDTVVSYTTDTQAGDTNAQAGGTPDSCVCCICLIVCHRPDLFARTAAQISLPSTIEFARNATFGTWNPRPSFLGRDDQHDTGGLRGSSGNRQQDDLLYGLWYGNMSQ
ncbi:hypothetical protein CERZMDRAFT_116434 [Cercospora zeae-maydis SCOH1-5]|uniref:AA1-like domain-containing protein n=1 Tax=Cercospora zeae-maydis SCOH1-5 TaxID=717836 RepID=A0A6A6FT73_9PEZI|nr:hypothetical protein CERZMDRAFT_116434 [Cercospora zeae-maydis SCOH1-5]